MSSEPVVIKTEKDFKHVLIHLGSTHAIAWTARYLDHMPGSADYYSESPEFYFYDATWSLRLYPDTVGYGSTWTGVRLARLSSRLPHHRLQYCLKSTEHVEIVPFEVADFDENQSEYGNMEFISHLRLNQYYYRRPVVEVNCLVSCYESSDLNAVSEFLMQDAKDLEVLSHNLKNLFLNGQGHDVVIKVKDKEFRAHQVILQARSPVFDSMLSQDIIQKNNGVIDVADCDPGAFEQFLFYLYSGRVETLDTENMLAMYYVADKYDTGHLKEDCHEFIKKSLTCDNVADILQLSLNHGDGVLQERATEVFKKRMRAVFQTAGWLSFVKNNPTQANEFLIKVIY